MRSLCGDVSISNAARAGPANPDRSGCCPEGSMALQGLQAAEEVCWLIC